LSNDDGLPYKAPSATVTRRGTVLTQ